MKVNFMAAVMKKRQAKAFNKHIIIDVQDNKYAFMMDLLNNFDFVKIQNPADEYMDAKEFRAMAE